MHCNTPDSSVGCTASFSQSTVMHTINPPYLGQGWGGVGGFATPPPPPPPLCAPPLTVASSLGNPQMPSNSMYSAHSPMGFNFRWVTVFWCTSLWYFIWCTSLWCFIWCTSLWYFIWCTSLWYFIWCTSLWYFIWCTSLWYFIWCTSLWYFIWCTSLCYFIWCTSSLYYFIWCTSLWYCIWCTSSLWTKNFQWIASRQNDSVLFKILKKCVKLSFVFCDC